MSESKLRAHIRSLLIESEDVESEVDNFIDKEFKTAHYNFNIIVDGKSGDVDVKIKSVDKKDMEINPISLNVNNIEGEENKMVADIIVGIGYHNRNQKVVDDLRSISDAIKAINPDYLKTKMTPRSHKARFDATYSKI